MPTPRTPISRLLRRGMALVLVVFAGCAGTGGASSPPAQPPGLTAYLWSYRADDASIAPYLADPPAADINADEQSAQSAAPIEPFGPGPTALWRANAIRVAAIPVQEAANLRAGAAPVGAMRELAMGESPAWTELARGPRWSAPLLTQLDTGDVRLDPGFVRLLCRAWIIPAEIPEAGDRLPAALQVELAIQHVRETTPARGSLEAMIPAPPTPIEHQGLILHRLTLAAALDGSHAIALLPIAAERARPAPSLGPPAPQPIRLGNLLIGLGPESSGGGALILLVPVVPGSFGLNPVGR